MTYETPPHIVGDVILSIPYIVCLLVGVPANCSALVYFMGKKRDLPTYLYILSSLNDMITNLSVIPVIVSLCQGREPVLFDNEAVCTLCGILIKLQASFSVFLVLVLSVTRSAVLVRPFMEVSTPWVMCIVVVYGVYLVLQQLVPLLLGKAVFVYTNSEVYCWDEGRTTLFSKVDLWLDIISVALPIFPITLSCIVSCVCVWRAPSMDRITQKKQQQQQQQQQQVDTPSEADRCKHKATMTIILMTIVYIIFNLPLLLNYILWLVIETSDVWIYPSPFYTTKFMYWYSWNLTDCLFINLNSLMNPLVYFMRIENYKNWVRHSTGHMRDKVVSMVLLHQISINDSGTQNHLAISEH